MGDSSQTVILNAGVTFAITDTSGNMVGDDHGFYDRDRRLVHRFTVLVAGRQPQPLSGRSLRPDVAQFFQSVARRPQSRHADLVLERQAFLRDGLLEVVLRLRNYGSQRLAIPVEVRVGADFAHIFTVKNRALGGPMPAHSLEVSHHLIDAEHVEFRVGGLPGHHGVALSFSAPARLSPVRSTRPRAAELRLRFEPWVPPREWTELSIVLQSLPRDALTLLTRRQPALDLPSPPEVRARGELGPALRRAYERSVEDLHSLTLQSRDNGLGDGKAGVAFAAGIPWYIALFGRDSLLTGHMTVFALPELGLGSLRALAHLQGKTFDPQAGEEPGKILHEFRPALAAKDDAIIPRFPYYGSVDATPLFVMGVEEQVRVTGNVELAAELAPAVRKAAAWLTGPGDKDGDGYLEYLLESDAGLVNQGWKDSWDAVHFRDGTLAQGPIALVEVQGYLYAAHRALARLYRQLGSGEEAAHHDRLARRLALRFHRDFWMPQRSFYALGLDGAKRHIDALTSNGLHVLWTGIAPRAAARTLAASLLHGPLWSGFGVRTLAAGEGRYNPISYHNGSVWPHDNALIAEGLRRYGCTEEALAIVEALVRSSVGPFHGRLAELFAGFSREESPLPVPYPSACPVQAWSAAAIPHALALMLGIEVHDHKVFLSPALPRGLDRLEVSGLRVLGERMDVVVQRETSGRLRCQVCAPAAIRVQQRRTRRTR